MEKPVLDRFIPCSECSSKEGPEGMPGYFYVKSNPPYPDKIKECRCHLKWSQNNLIRLRTASTGIWSNDQALEYNPMSDYAGNSSRYSMRVLVTYANQFEKYKDVTFYLYGRNSTQKTTLAQWVGLTLMRSGYQVKYVTMNGLIESLQHNFGDTRIDYTIDYSKYDCLIIDESFDVNKVSIYKSGYQFPFLDNFLRERIQPGNLSTIFISNIDPQSIVDEGFPLSIQELVVRNTLRKGTALAFEDNYEAVTSRFNFEDIQKEIDKKV
jgi:hypothetical protein